MTPEQVREVVRAAVKETLAELGVDASNPFEMQRDFSALREWRIAYTKVRAKAVMTVVGILVAATLAALWVGIKAAVSGK